MRHLFKLLTASSLMLSACAPGGIGEGFSTMNQEVVTTYSPARTTTYKDEKYEVIHGATKIGTLETNYEGEIHRMTLKGEITLNPVSNRGTIHVPVDLAGISTKDGYVYLQPWNPEAKQVKGLKLGAKATCIGENLNCSSSFIDIYIELDGKIYHHQVESFPKEDSATKGDVKDPTQDDGPGVSTPDDEIFEEREPEEEQATGRYIGTLDDDIDNILKKDDKKAEEPKKDDSKKDDSKKDDSKKDQPQKDDGKKEEPKKEQPKKDDSKKDEPKKEEPKKDDSKKEETPAPVSNKKVQAIGTPFTDPQTKKEGRLQNAINMVELEKKLEPAGFKVLRPERYTHFATSETAYLIQLMGKFAKEHTDGLTVTVGDVSREKGGIWYRSGKAWGHQSHQNGLDADIPYFFNNKSFQGYFASALAVNKLHPNWMKEEQWEMFKVLAQTKLVDRIFIHGTLKKALCELAIKNGELVKGRDSLASDILSRMRPDPQHHNHFHIRAKCGKDQVLCKQMVDPAKDSGCF